MPYRSDGARMRADQKPNQVTILRPADRERGTELSKPMRQHSNRIRHAKLELVSVLMRLDELGVDVARIDLRAALEFGRKLSSLGEI